MKLSRREKYAVLLAAAFIGLFVIIRFGVLPLQERDKALQRQLSARRSSLAAMLELKGEYQSLEKNFQRFQAVLKKRPPGFSLFSFMNRQADAVGENGIKASYTKPSKSEPKDRPYSISLVEMKFEDINLKQLAQYLHLVENSDNLVFVRRLSIKRKGKDEGLLDVILQVETFEI